MGTFVQFRTANHETGAKLKNDTMSMIDETVTEKQTADELSKLRNRQL